MVFSSLKTLFALFLSLSTLRTGVSASLPEEQHVFNDTVVHVEDPDTLRVPPPHFVIYADRWISGTLATPPVSQVKGYNVYVLSFLLLSGPADKALEWTQLSASKRASIKSKYHAAGIKLIVSLFGSTDIPTTLRADPVATADTMAAWVKKFKLDGVDVDYEDFGAINAGNGKAEAWLVAFTKRLRSRLPRGQYILTHAPVAPWFSPHIWGGGGYLKIHKSVGHLIDWYNVQFYNQGINEYTTCSGLLTKSSNVFPRSALFQIHDSGVPLSMLVIGKPATRADASNGFMSAEKLAGCVQQAKNKGWRGGVMFWQFFGGASSLIRKVRGSAFPL